MSGEAPDLQRMAEALESQNLLAQEDLVLRRVELEQALATERACIEQVQAERERQAIEQERLELSALLCEEEKLRNIKLDQLIVKTAEMLRRLHEFGLSEPERRRDLKERMDAILMGMQVMFGALVREWGDSKHYEEAMAIINKYATSGQSVKVEAQSGGARFGDIDDLSGQVAGGNIKKEGKDG